MRSRFGSTILAAALFMFLAGPLAGQVTGGPRVGISISNLGGDDISGTDSRTGLAVGWAFGVPAGERWSIQPEFHYWEKGASTRFFGVQTDLDLSYLEVPVLLRVDLTQGSSFTPHVLVGPTFGINLTCTARVSAGPFSGEQDCADRENFDVNALDFGVAAGFGVSADMGGWDLSADARYAIGLADVLDRVNVRNRGFGLLVGASFPLTR
jgi:hypothetical protein